VSRPVGQDVLGDPTFGTWSRSLDRILADPKFRAWQAAWRRRIAASRRADPLKDGWTTDPLAPSGRWAA